MRILMYYYMLKVLHPLQHLFPKLCCWCYIDSTIIIIVVIIIAFTMKGKYSFWPVIGLEKQRKTRFCARNEKLHIAVFIRSRKELFFQSQTALVLNCF
ncbi:hypothetical protein VIGAN_05238100, partial [Vigna angularis var. angularis]